MEYARFEFELNSADEHGVTVREHYEQIGKDADLQPPPFPDVLAYIWEWFIELHQARPAGGMGPGPLTYGDIKAWCHLVGNRLAPWEVRAIKGLDSIWLGAVAEQQKRTK